jgi:hypothetical protein
MLLHQSVVGSVQDLCAYFSIEMNLAANVGQFQAGIHPGYEQAALEGIRLTLDLINEKRIKVILNGGALNPSGLAGEVQRMVS